MSASKPVMSTYCTKYYIARGHKHCSAYECVKDLAHELVIDQTSIWVTYNLDVFYKVHILTSDDLNDCIKNNAMIFTSNSAYNS